jgi:hypothetical protein
MKKQKVIEHCRVCGLLKEMSEEHIPPQSAYNDQQVMFKTLQDEFGFSGKRYSKSPNGIKRYSICETCNNSIGGDYGTAFVEWTRQACIWLDKLGGQNALFLHYDIKPLNVIKQIMTMTLAVSSEQRRGYYEELRRFVFNRHQKYLPLDLRVYVYFKRENTPRFSDMEGVIFRTDIGAIEYVNAEIALPPLGYCITSTSPKKKGRSIAEHEGLYEITWFSEYAYNEMSRVWLRLPIKEAHEAYPLDYRPYNEIPNPSWPLK